MGTHVTTSDLEIWTEQVGLGPDVLLIGGLGDTVESWQFQLDGLANRYRLTAFDNRAQPCLQAVGGPLGVAEPVDGAAVPKRGVPVLARLGHAAESAVQQAGDFGAVQRCTDPGQLDELLLVAAARPAAVQPQQVA